MINNESEVNKEGIRWHEVTWYSRILAVVLFVIVLPALSFYVGMRFEEMSSPKEVVSPDKIFSGFPDHLYPREVRDTKSDNAWFRKDGEQVYVKEGYGDAPFYLLSGADAGSFEVLVKEHIEGAYAKDANSVYCVGKDFSVGVLSGADPASFQVAMVMYASSHDEADAIPITVGMDSERVYFNCSLSEADPDTFEFIESENGSGSYAKDATGVYFMGYTPTSLVPFTRDISGFEILFDLEGMKARRYSKDSSSVYYAGKLIPNADVESFRLLADDEQEEIGHVTYTDAQDKNHVYSKGTLVR